LRRLLLGLLALNVALLVVGELVAVRRAAERPRTGIKVGLVFDVGGRGDKSFNDAAWKGLVRARDELGVAIQAIEPGDGSDREGALRQLAAGGADLVIGVGFIFSRDLDRLAADFPDVKFAGIDYAPDENKPIPPNLAALRFREHEGSFVVGAIAGMTTKSKVVGFVGGMKIPLIRKFEVGYAAGVRHVCPECEVLSAYAGTEPKAFADPTLGRELADSQYGRGADVIFHASGKTGSGVFAAARERRRFAIGVDGDQFDEAPCCVLTSMIKKVDVAVVDVTRSVIEGNFAGGVHELGLADDGVGFVADARNADRFPPDRVARAKEIAAAIVAGTIEVPSQ
jgi:basic membrane protein A and related proteins